MAQPLAQGMRDRYAQRRDLRAENKKQEPVATHHGLGVKRVMRDVLQITQHRLRVARCDHT